MIGKGFVPSLLFLLIISASLHAATWQTRAYGNWSDGNCWNGNVAPSHNSADTFIIDHPIIIDNSLVFSAGANVLINAGGGLCGHHNLRVEAGAIVLKYGILEVDTLLIPGGKVVCRAPGDVILTRAGILTNNGLMDVNGCSVAVGPWFNCKLPEYSFAATGVNNYSQSGAFSMYPNPSHGQLVLHGKIDNSDTWLEFIDQVGWLVYSRKVLPDNMEQRQVAIALPLGVYLWQLRTHTAILERGKISIISE